MYVANSLLGLCSALCRFNFLCLGFWNSSLCQINNIGIFLLSCCSTDAEFAVPMRAKVEAIAIANAFEGLIITNSL